MVAPIFTSISGPLQTVQRAEYWSVIITLQAFLGTRAGIDNLREVARLLHRGNKGVSPLSRTVISLPSSTLCFGLGVMITFPRLKVTLTSSWLPMDRSDRMMEMLELILQLISGVQDKIKM